MVAGPPVEAQVRMLLLNSAIPSSVILPGYIYIEYFDKNYFVYNGEMVQNALLKINSSANEYLQSFIFEFRYILSLYLHQNP